MKEYHKIQTVFKRDSLNNNKTVLLGQYSLPEFEYLKNNLWIFTEKVDGTNIRVIYNGKSISFKGKTDNAQIPAILVNKLNEKFLPQLQLFRETFGVTPACFYGEGYGAKIQKGGGNYKQEQDYVLFDVLINDYWLLRDNIKELAEKFSIDTVPIIGQGNLFEMADMAMRGFDSVWGNFRAEGIVARPAIELKTRNGHRIITKIKHKDF